MAKRNHCRDALINNYPPCPRCHAERGDPCRDPSTKSRAPHAERLAAIDAERSEVPDTGA